MAEFEIIRVTPENVDKYGIGCIRDRKHPGYVAKVNWFLGQYENGLTLKIGQNDGKYAGFIEYIPGEHAWRPVDAKGYLFIHCIWVYGKSNVNSGLGSALVQSCIDDARDGSFRGVAVVVSDGSWMANSSLFMKSGFQIIERKGRFELLAMKFEGHPSPAFLDWETEARVHSGFELLYSHQCPANAKSIRDIQEAAREAGIRLTMTEITDDALSRNAPTGFGVFQLLYDGEVLADHYISGTRFRNIIRKKKLS